MRHEDYVRQHFPVPTGWIVDVGAYDGEFLSWSLPLEKEGWDVLCIEGNPEMEAQLKSRGHHLIAAVSDSEREADFYVYTREPYSYSGLIKHTDACTQVTVVTKTLTQCLDGLDVISVLGLDVEGVELEALAGFDFKRWQPKLIFCEDHFDNGDAVAEYLAARGYSFVGSIDYDKVYLHNGDVNA